MRLTSAQKTAIGKSNKSNEDLAAQYLSTPIAITRIKAAYQRKLDRQFAALGLERK